MRMGSQRMQCQGDQPVQGQILGLQLIHGILHRMVVSLTNKMEAHEKDNDAPGDGLINHGQLEIGVSNSQNSLGVSGSLGPNQTTLTHPRGQGGHTAVCGS